MGAVRLLGFFLGAAGLELARGIGLVALVLALLLGLLRRRSVWLLPVAVGAAAASAALPEGTGGKVEHGLSNFPFVLLLYLALTLVGYAAGRVLRSIAGR